MFNNYFGNESQFDKNLRLKHDRGDRALNDMRVLFNKQDRARIIKNEPKLQAFINGELIK